MKLLLKIGFIFILIMSLIPAYVFAYDGGLLDTLPLNIYNSNGTISSSGTLNLTDDNIGTEGIFNANGYMEFVFTDTKTINRWKWQKASSSRNFTLELYDIDDVLLYSNTVNSANYDNTFTAVNGVKKVKFVNADSVAIGVQEFDVFGSDDVEPDTTPPSEVSNLSEVHDHDSITLSYDFPTDLDFQEVVIKRGIDEVYRGIETTFTDLGLSPNTSYTYRVQSVDNSNNVSNGVVLTVTTDSEVLPEEPPSIPSGLEVVSGNGSLLATWNKNPESNVTGYNIYLDGVLNGTSTYNSHQIHNLTNGQTYYVSVSAINSFDLESTVTSEVYGIPDENLLPIMGLDYDLKDISDGTSNWFSSLWLIVAFSVAIPLSFLIANRVKGLFVS